MPQTKQQKRLGSLNRLRLSMDIHSRNARQPAATVIARKRREFDGILAAGVADVIKRTEAAIQRG
jgi:exonuclease III